MKRIVAIVGISLLGLAGSVVTATRAAAENEYWSNEYWRDAYWQNPMWDRSEGWRVTERYRDPRRYNLRASRNHGPTYERKSDCENFLPFVKPDHSGSRIACERSGF